MITDIFYTLINLTNPVKWLILTFKYISTEHTNYSDYSIKNLITVSIINSKGRCFWVTTWTLWLMKNIFNVIQLKLSLVNNYPKSYVNVNHLLSLLNSCKFSLKNDDELSTFKQCIQTLRTLTIKKWWTNSQRLQQSLGGAW